MLDTRSERPLVRGVVLDDSFGFVDALVGD